jgi:hypothetical protein
MKTVKDLKIGDTIYSVYNNGIDEDKITLMNIKNSEYAIRYGNSNHSNDNYERIKDETTFLNGYKNVIYLNKSEAIMAVKESIRSDINDQMKSIAKECEKLVDLKELMFKYL